MRYQQNLTGRKMALVVIGTNNWSLIQSHIAAIIAAIDAVNTGQLSRGRDSRLAGTGPNVF
jgi:hypothetical protein